MDLKARFRRRTSEIFSVSEENITDNTVIVDDLGADSIDFVELAMAAEDEFGVEIPDEDIEEIFAHTGSNPTFGEIVERLKKVLDRKGKIG